MHPNEALARREFELINSGQFDALEDLYAVDLVLHYPGRNPLAGTYIGLAEFVGKLEALIGDGTIKRELHDAFGTDGHAVQLLSVSAEVRGRSHSWSVAIVMHVREGKFSEVWFHFDDQYALDAFLTSLAN